MDEQYRITERVRQACIDAAIRAYEEAGLSGLCHEGRWEYAVDVMRGVDLRSLLSAHHTSHPQQSGSKKD